MIAQTALVRVALWFAAVLEAVCRVLSILLGIWRTRTFWWQNRLHLLPVAFGILFWWRVIVGAAHGVPPLLGWMISAYLSVWITAAIVSRIILSLDDSRRSGPAMLLLQLGIILLANTFVIGQMVVLEQYFRPADMYVFSWAMATLVVVVALLTWRRKSFSSDWALCGYSVALKSAPQVVQAWFLYKGMATLEPWSALFLFCQGLSRWGISFGMWRSGRSEKTRAQLTNASFDLLTIGAIFWVVLSTCWWQVVESILPSADFIVTVWEAVK